MWLAALLIAAVLGYCVVRLWLPAGEDGSPWTMALHAGLGAGLGLGLTSCLYFLLLAAGAGGPYVIPGLEVAVLGVLFLLVLRRGRAAPAASSPSSAAHFSWNWFLALGLAAMLALFFAGFVSASSLNPQGGWDAFAIWNLRARFLLYSETWKHAVTPLPVGTHMEYPLLLSSTIARAWRYGGDTTQAVPIAIACVFPVALVTLMVSALSRERRTSIGLLSGIVLLANPSFLDQAPNQYADLPLSFFALAALVLVSFHCAGPSHIRYLSLAGVFAGLATWTKNEGMLVLAALTAALFVSAWRSDGLRPAARQCGTLLLGALPLLLLTLWFKVAVAPRDPLAGQIGANVAQHLANPGRWVHVAAGFLKQAWELAAPLAILALTGAVLGLRPRAARCLTPWIAAAVALAGYFLVFMLTSDDIDWLLGTALERLYAQLWPVLVLAVFLVVRCPEDLARSLAVPPTPRRPRKTL